RQPAEVAMQMLLDLPLRLDDEAQAQRVARAAREQADAKGAGVPERVEQAGAIAEIAQPLLGPRKMIGLVASRRLEVLPQSRITRGQRLRGIERLRADLAHMIHAHE